MRDCSFTSSSFTDMAAACTRDASRYGDIVHANAACCQHFRLPQRSVPHFTPPPRLAPCYPNTMETFYIYIYIYKQVVSFHTFSHHRLVRCVNIPSSNKFTVSSQTADSYLPHETLLRNSPSIRWAQWQLVLQTGSTSNTSGQLLCTLVLFVSYVQHIRQSHPERYK